MDERIRRMIALTLVLILGGTAMFGFFGCKKKSGVSDPPKGKKYRVIYENDCKSSFDGAKDEYRAGERVELAFGMIATDTDYTFYVDGAEHTVDYDDRGYVIKFTMPENDVTVGWSSRNSMVYVPDPEPGDVLVDYYTATVGTDGYDSSRELVLYYLNDDEAKLTVFIKPSPDAETEETSYTVPYSAASRCDRQIERERLDSWDYIEDKTAIDGAVSTLRFRYMGQYYRVSTDDMPEGGEKSIYSVGAILEEYVKDEYLAD